MMRFFSQTFLLSLVWLELCAAACVLPGDLACGTKCYQPTAHVCADASTSFLCPVAQPNKCGDACYSTAQYSCVEGQLQPPCALPGDLKCGTTCYNPTTHVCADSTNAGFLCPIVTPLKCGGSCYSSAQYKCVEGALEPVSAPNPTQAPTAAPTAAPGCVIPGDLKCGTRCYAPTTHVCADAVTSFLCPLAYPLKCGANACYSSAQYACVAGALEPIPKGNNPTQAATTAPTTVPPAAPGCGLPGDLKCGTKCYAPTTHVCADSTNGGFLCPVAYPLKCGADACYSSAQYTCVAGALQPKN